MATTSKPKSSWPIVVIGLVLIPLFAVAVKLLMAANPGPGFDDAARAVERTEAREALMAENAQKLGTYAWADKAKGQVQIPIQRAMELVTEELNSRPPQPVVPEATPAPAAPAQAAPAATPAPEAAAPAPSSAAPAAEPSASPEAQPASVH